MDYNEHKKYFEIAYRNGADLWTHLPMKARGEKLREKLPIGSLILDVGSGRGLFAKELADAGYRVIGIDFEKNIIEKANSHVKSWGLEGKLKFREADVLDIPFTNASFDGICDFGLLENLYQKDWLKYAEEINRVLKIGGFYLNVSLSRETLHFFDFSPKASLSGDFQKYGVHYHFFEKEEINELFKNFNLLSQENEVVHHKPTETIFLESLYQKK
jgi:ubiquinone/menaquinone biosynthesis C-methylase UbiE